jgi:hypothetical protein
MMRMLAYEINSGINREYSYVHILNEEEAYHELATHVRMSPLSDLPQPELVHQLAEKWVWIITIGAMAAVSKKVNKVGQKNLDISLIQKYLAKSISASTKSLIDSKEVNPINKAIAVVTEELDAVDYVQTKTGAAILKITKRLFSPEYQEARQALLRELQRSKKLVLVMVDSIELYNLRDNISQAVVTSLMDAARRLYGVRNTTGIICKVALPSEIYPHLSSANQEKIEGKNLFILWRYRDLVSVLAKRYMQFAEKGPIENLKVLDDYREARVYLYKWMPKTVLSTTGIEFDTLAYIIRHTQKKPRQVILLLNIILTLAEKRAEDIKHIGVEIIKKGIHARLDILVKGTLDIYETIYPKAGSLVKRALSDTPSVFDYSRLDQQMKEIRSLRADLGIGSEEAKRLFMESGVLGIRRGRHNFPLANKVLLEALFEYQVKGTLFLTNSSRCVIHPMFYQELLTEIDRDTFTYPMPAEQEEVDMLKEAGIVLGSPSS